MDIAAAHHAFKRAVEKAKSQSAFAREVGASQQLISYLLKHKKPLSAKYVLPAERAYGVPRHELRADIYPPSDGSPSPRIAVVSDGAPIVACDRSANSHLENAR